MDWNPLKKQITSAYYPNPSGWHNWGTSFFRWGWGLQSCYQLTGKSKWISWPQDKWSMLVELLSDNHLWSKTHKKVDTACQGQELTSAQVWGQEQSPWQPQENVQCTKWSTKKENSREQQLNRSDKVYMTQMQIMGKYQAYIKHLTIKTKYILEYASAGLQMQTLKRSIFLKE